MASPRRTWLTVVAVLGCVLLPSGVALVVSGLQGSHGGRTVLGILLGLAGLICFRILRWSRRIRLMTEAGRVMHGDDKRTDGAHPDGR